MAATTVTTRHLRMSGVTGMPAMPVRERTSVFGADNVARYRCVLAPAFVSLHGSGPSTTGAVAPMAVNTTALNTMTVNPISKAAVLGDTPGTSTWSPPV